ncbi:MAG: glycine betaine ABC transporter substrate-binding protein [Planctomycetota bacterium]
MRAPALGAALLLAALGARADTITIGSKNFPESGLLAEVMAQLIEAETELEVERRANLGGTTVVFTALKSGDIDIYPEYTGTGWAVLLGIPQPVSDPLEAFVRVREGFEREWGLTWAKPFGFNNSYAIALRKDLAQELGVTRLSDLREHAGRLQAGVSPEFLKRGDGWPGLSQTYGLGAIPVRGMEHGLAYSALANDRIQLVDAYTTDAKLVKYDLLALRDDRRYFPPYDCAPVVRQDTLAAHPELQPVLDRLAFRLSDQHMLVLNSLVELDGFSAAEVARAYLLGEGLVQGAPSEPERVAQAQALIEARAQAGADLTLEETTARPSVWAFMRGRVGITLRLAAEHLMLAGLAVLLTVLVAVPLGVLVYRDPNWRWLIGAAGVIQTIPSLALLAFMIPIPGFGLSPQSAIAALFLYAILPVLRNTATGLTEVDPDLVEAARAMGLTEGRILTRIQLPLATNTIMAGIRTATVISIGVATLAAFIGAGGLGQPIFVGLQLNDRAMIFAGAVPAALLALGVDQLLGLLERALAPKGLG